MIRFVCCVAALSGLLLSGCTNADWNRTMTYAGMGDAPAAAAPAAPQPIAARPDPAAADANFCQGVAKQDSSSDAFDASTQQRMFQRSFQQCMMLFGSEAASQGTLAAN